MLTSETQASENSRAELDKPEHRAAVLEAKGLLYKRLKVQTSSPECLFALSDSAALSYRSW